jgi:hypothetical protein
MLQVLVKVLKHKKLAQKLAVVVKSHGVKKEQVVPVLVQSVLLSGVLVA